LGFARKVRTRNWPSYSIPFPLEPSLSFRFQKPLFGSFLFGKKQRVPWKEVLGLLNLLLLISSCSFTIPFRRVFQFWSEPLFSPEGARGFPFKSGREQTLLNSLGFPLKGRNFFRLIFHPLLRQYIFYQGFFFPGDKGGLSSKKALQGNTFSGENTVGGVSSSPKL